MGQCDDPLSRHRTRDVGGDAPVHAAATVPDPTLDPYDGGAIAAVRTWHDEDPPRGIEVKPVWVRTVLDRTDWLEDLRRLASTRRLQLRVAGEFPPEQAAEAHRLMAAGGLRGRAMIVF